MIISESEKKAQGSHRKNPASAVIKERYLLTHPHSVKQVYHLSLDLQNAPLSFAVGDSLGIFPQNDPEEVQKLVKMLGKTENEPINDPRSGISMRLWDFLSQKANLQRIDSSLFHLPLQEWCEKLSPLLPRFYSVASSPSFTPGEVHLTVSLTIFGEGEQQRYGVASHFLCHLAKLRETPIPVYVQKTPHFALPQDDATPLIMVGPGTGIAPFRGFMQERLLRRAKGNHWLFFGDRERHSNYYYKEFWEDLATQNLLKLSVAFSRDQPQKIYVQHLMQEHAKELFGWLEEGAHFYVCGDRERMAKGVDATLHDIIERQGGLSSETAKAYVKALRTQKRYLIDVY